METILTFAVGVAVGYLFPAAVTRLVAAFNKYRNK